MRSPLSPFRRPAGFSLIELLLVLGVLAVLLVAAFALYPRIRDTNQGRDQARHAVILQDNIQALYGRRGRVPDYTSLTTSLATRAGLFPKSLWPTHTAITQVPTPYDGRVLVGSTGTTAVITPRPGALSTGRAFYIRFTLVPRVICVALATQAGPYFDGVRITNTYVMTPTGLNVTEIAKQCDSDVPVTVTFYSA